MIIDERFVFYCLGLVCGFVLLEVFRVVAMFRSRRAPVRKDTGEGYKSFVDKYKKLYFKK